ncbi:MAG: hypothetical protein JXL84_06845 [Deltaproteobacteria bacterium]|nr:hypothetical protein [Deltaproteobacteria bacterium]
MLPANEWWGILGAYGAAVWPAQAAFYSIGLLLLVFVFLSGKPIFNLLTKLYMAVSFCWISLVFFLTLGKGLAGGAFFASLFMMIAILFGVDIFRQRMVFRLPEVGWQRGLTLCLALIVMGYPLFSLALGRPLEKTIVPGTFPCPTTAMALVLLATSLPRVNKVLYILLLFWAIPFPPLIQIPRYGVYEDIIMLGVGVYGLVMLVKHWKAGYLSAMARASARAR